MTLIDAARGLLKQADFDPKQKMHSVTLLRDSGGVTHFHSKKPSSKMKLDGHCVAINHDDDEHHANKMAYHLGEYRKHEGRYTKAIIKAKTLDDLGKANAIRKRMSDHLGYHNAHAAAGNHAIDVRSN